MLGDRVGVIDAGRVVQQGTAGELAATPASAFVADFTGAVVLTGTARTGLDGLTRVALDGGGTVASTEPGEGPVAVSIYPWEIVLAPAGTRPRTPPRTTWRSTSSRSPPSATGCASASPRRPPLTAEVSDASARRLGLAPGTRAVASWKASATRLLSR